MSDTAEVIRLNSNGPNRPPRDVGVEERRANTRRLVHEFAVYVVWHLSLTKPTDNTAMRVLVNDMLREWIENEYKCGTFDCPYCLHKTHSYANRTGFRSMFRNLIGQKDRGK